MALKSPAASSGMQALKLERLELKSGAQALLHRPVLSRVCLHLYLLAGTHLHSERRHSYSEIITKVRNGLKGSQIQYRAMSV